MCSRKKNTSCPSTDLSPTRLTNAQTKTKQSPGWGVLARSLPPSDAVNRISYHILHPLPVILAMPLALALPLPLPLPTGSTSASAYANRPCFCLCRIKSHSHKGLGVALSQMCSLICSLQIYNYGARRANIQTWSLRNVR